MRKWLTLFVLLAVMFVGMSAQSAYAVGADRRIILAPGPSPVAGEHRFALVIGNADYAGRGVQPLKNPLHDADAVARTLTRLGFKVTELRDGTRMEIRDSVDAFTQEVSEAGEGAVALLYYSGHGMQVDGKNYLIPIGFNIPQNKLNMDDEGYPMQKALDSMKSAGARVNIVILDACRDNPYDQGRGFSGKGLAGVQPEGIYVAYATAENSVADDNPDSDNGLYTQALLRSMKEPGEDLLHVFQDVKKRVYEESRHSQLPFENNGLVDANEFYFDGRSPSTLVTGPMQTPTVPLPVEPTPIGPPVPANYDVNRAKTSTNSVDGAEMIWIPAGEFTMGDDTNAVSAPVHKVTLDGYYIYKKLVSVAMYEKFCEATHHAMPQRPVWGWDKEDYPIVNVTWSDALAYCAWAGASLPTEAEWEKAARGTDGRRYPWGNDWNPDNCRHSLKAFGDISTPSSVDEYPEGASPYGVLDMAGNVWQWCSDWYDSKYYSRSPGHNPKGARIGGTRVLRGGSWYDSQADIFRTAHRNGNAPQGSTNNLGFRCVVRPD